MPAGQSHNPLDSFEEDEGKSDIIRNLKLALSLTFLSAVIYYEQGQNVALAFVYCIGLSWILVRSLTRFKLLDTCLAIALAMLGIALGLYALVLVALGLAALFFALYSWPFGARFFQSLWIKFLDKFLPTEKGIRLSVFKSLNRIFLGEGICIKHPSLGVLIGYRIEDDPDEYYWLSVVR